MAEQIISEIRLSRKSRIRANAIADAEKTAWAAEYAGGKSTVEIAEANGFSVGFIRKAVIEAGAVIRHGQDRTHKLTPEQKSALAAEYLAGATIEEVSSKYGIKKCSGWELLKRRGLTRPTSETNRRYTLNHAAFAAPLTPEAQYWVGMMMTDGFIMRRKGCSPTAGIQLSQKDDAHIVAFGKFLGTDQTPTRFQPKRYAKSFNSGPASRIDVRSRQIVADLATYGVVQNKSHVAEARNGIELSPHFWRGCIDGDGSIAFHPTAPYASLCGASYKFMKQFSDFCISVAAGVRATVNESRPGFYNVRIGGGYAILLLRELYRDGTISLSRKEVAAKMILDHARKNPNWCNKRGSFDHRYEEFLFPI